VLYRPDDLLARPVVGIASLVRDFLLDQQRVAATRSGPGRWVTGSTTSSTWLVEQLAALEGTAVITATAP